jgi:membrane-associated phospholipid phosphatase
MKLASPAFLALIVLAAAMALFAAFPQLDLELARRFYLLEGGSFNARFDRPLILVRDLGYYLPIAVLALAMLAWLLGRRKSGFGAAPGGRAVLYLALSFALGPGLLVNGLLKEISHRPRPVQVTEFGGASAFKPWYAFDGACKKNCSFVSGETAGATWLVAPASLVPPPWRAVAVSCATLFALGVALLRLAFGGHFPSDVIGAALVTLATLLALAHLMRRTGRAKEL